MKHAAFARALVTARDRGQHPERVWVLAGDDWTPPSMPNGAVIALRASDDPEGIHWWPLAGLPVHIAWRGHPRWWCLACLIARHTAPVVLHPSPYAALPLALAQGGHATEESPAVDWSMSLSPYDVQALFPLWGTLRADAPSDWARTDEEDYRARRAAWLVEHTASACRDRQLARDVLAAYRGVSQ